MKVFKEIEVSSKYHSLDKAIFDIQLFDDRIVVETLNYTIMVNFDSIATLRNKDIESVDCIVNDSSVLSNIYFTKMAQSDCDLLVSTYENYQK